MGCLSLRYYEKISIDSSKIFHGKVYFKFNSQIIISGQGSCGYSFIQNRAYCRVDSTSGNIYIYSQNYNECPLTLYEGIVDSLKSKRGDTAYVCNGGVYYPTKGLSDTSNYSFLE